MTDIVNPSRNRVADSFLTAGAIAYATNVTDGFIIPSSESPTDLATDEGLTTGNLNEFSESSSSSSLDVDIDGGEAIVFGSYLARDTVTTVTLQSSTNDQVVYLGWDIDNPDTAIVGLDGDFPSNAKRIELYSYDTDGSGVTN